MEDKFVDEFDQFCRIAKNPITESTLGSYNLCNVETNLYRSNSMRERIPKKLKETKTDNNLSNSIAASNDENKIVRVRSFRRTTKGVVCNKDTIEIEPESELNKSPDKRFQNSYSEKVKCHSERKIESDNVKLLNDYEKIRYTVTLLGPDGVGKTSLCQQLLIPECLVSQSDEMNPNNEAQMIRVLVDNQESILQFIDNDNLDINPEKQNLSDAYLVIYAIDDNSSFEECRKLIANLVLANVNPPLVILVGNKSDLVRSRVVSSDKGKRLASIYNLKFKEISTSLNHCVDELLVLLVTEMRNITKKTEKQKAHFISKRVHKTPYRSSLRIKVSNNAVSRFIQKHFNKSSENVSIYD